MRRGDVGFGPDRRWERGSPWKGARSFALRGPSPRLVAVRPFLQVLHLAFVTDEIPHVFGFPLRI